MITSHITLSQGHPIEIITPVTPAGSYSLPFAIARIWLIDFTPEQADRLEQMLLVDGHLIERIAAPGALASLERSAPDLMVCGAICSVVRALKSMPGLAPAPLIMLGVPEERLAGLDAGADDFLTMPADPVELRLRVRNLLRLTRSAQRSSAVAQLAADPESIALGLSRAREQERSSLARELHDELGQCLTLLKIDLHHLRAFLHGDAAMLAWQGVDGDVDMLGASMRAIAAALRPAALDDIGLEAALRKLLQRQFAHDAAHCVFEYAGLPARLGPGIEIALYRIVQECVTNIARHAGATRVVVEINGGASGAELELIVRDNGCGFDPAVMHGGFDPAVMHGGSGLHGVKERAQLLGGLFFLESKPQGGTRITVQLPLKPSREK